MVRRTVYWCQYCRMVFLDKADHRARAHPDSIEWVPEVLGAGRVRRR